MPDRWILYMREGKPAGYVVAGPGGWRYVEHALPAVVDRDTSGEPVKIRIRRRAREHNHQLSEVRAKHRQAIVSR